ncbi:hypothetical protein AHF37_12453 [Paragonimus kellicotti]|nr:hypothetical protein AHF37_12453 [Paragonimus kellicotti]
MYGTSRITDIQSKVLPYFVILAEIGLGLMGFGGIFLFLGILLLFDSALLALGNILFLAGLGCVTGAKGTVGFFFKGDSYRGALFFFGGLAVVFFGFPVIGILLEFYGILKLFR